MGWEAVGHIISMSWVYLQFSMSLLFELNCKEIHVKQYVDKTPCNLIYMVLDGHYIFRLEKLWEVKFTRCLILHEVQMIFDDGNLLPKLSSNFPT